MSELKRSRRAHDYKSLNIGAPKKGPTLYWVCRDGDHISVVITVGQTLTLRAGPEIKNKNPPITVNVKLS